MFKTYYLGRIFCTWIFHALVAVWTGPTWLAPAVIGSVAPTVVSVTPYPTDGLRAKVPRPARLAVALHGLVTIAVLGVPAWQRDADITVLAYPPRVATETYYIISMPQYSVITHRAAGKITYSLH